MVLSSERRADHLYEYCKDDKIADACAQLGFKRTSLWIVRLTQEGLCHIKAVGVNGKRSAILAVVVACLVCEVIAWQEVCGGSFFYVGPPKLVLF